MRRFLLPVSVLCLVIVTTGAVHARNKKKPQKRFIRDWSPAEFEGLDIPLPDHLKPDFMQTAAAADTYTIIYYDFEPGNWQGWTRLDNTAQVDTFWHVDDFDGLGGGDTGGLVPLEGTKSMWCGARPGNDEYMCSWEEAPGYGNTWVQILTTQAIPVNNPVRFSYKIHFDTEPGYDAVLVEFEQGNRSWEELASYTGKGDTTASHEYYTSNVATKLRFHFSSDGAYSDEDGEWNSDGAVVVDSLIIADNNGFYDYEDFESADIGDKQSGYWNATVPAPYGMYSGLYGSLVAADNDPCNHNFSTQIVFFVGSGPIPTPPWLVTTPFCKGPGGISAPCQNESVISPVIDLTRYSSSGHSNVQDSDIPSGELGDLGGAILKFTAYEDLPLQNLVFYTWYVRSIVDGCPGQWKTHPYVYWYGYMAMGYVIKTREIARYIESDSIQVSFNVFDYCDAWYLVNGNCAEHTLAPWFDNVYVKRYKAIGPQWSYRDMDLFQDNFPSEELDMESIVRADAANDLNPGDDPVIRPGDSIVVTCYSQLGGGIAEDGGGPRVYMHVKCNYIGDPGAPKPPLAGATLEGNCGYYVSDDGTWTIIQGDSARTASGNVTEDKFAFDLNDSLFTRGYMIEYYFEAFDNDGDSSTLPNRARTHDTFFEFTCLPTLASDILYVDDFHGRGTLEGYVEIYMDWSFRSVIPPENYPDRYDVNNPSSLVGNGLGSRAKSSQLAAAYKKMIWDSGNLENGTFCTGDPETSGKSLDCQTVIDWLALSEHPVGLWVLGDDVAYDLDGQAASSALELMSTWCGVTLVHNSYFELTGGGATGGIATPLVHSVPGVPNINPLHSDSFYVDGGCPIINAFDVLGTTESSQYALEYPPYMTTQYYAGVQNQGVNDTGHPALTMWFGFSFMYIRDADFSPASTIVRNRVMAAIIEWMGNEIGYAEHDETPVAYKLEQNYPNPFNPVTTIRYSVRSKGQVSLKIYNVAGQLVRVLVNEVKDPGVYKAGWNGRNDRGSKVTSGVYFYCMEAKDYRSTKKMVLLR